MENFKNLGLSESLLMAIEKKGFEEPTSIQEKTIPVLLESDRDIIAQAETGTGKTAAFGLVFMEKLLSDSNQTQALVLTPTRELAIQVAEEINSFKGNKKFSIIPIYGGQSITLQIKQLKKGINIVIGTPGRILDHLRKKNLNLKNIKYAVLDEADEMLNMGFIEDVEDILSYTNDQKQLLLFSATMPERIKSLAKSYMKEPVIIQTKKNKLTTHLIDQIYFEVRNSDKFEALCRIIDAEEEFYGIVFCRTKVDVDAVAKKLSNRGYQAEGIHGDIPQSSRVRTLNGFKDKYINILVATDVAARGIDVSNLTHVINFAIPQDPESYVHRIGRTGRAGNEGTAITLITPDEYRKLGFIKRIAKTEIRREKVPEIEDIIEIKKNKIRTELSNIIQNENIEYYQELVNGIVGDFDKNQAIAALLKYSFSQELDMNNYNPIKEITKQKDFSINMEGKTRLFLTVGKKDNMTPKTLLDLIFKESKIKPHFINNIEIFDTYSFITVPFKEAEMLLKVFKTKIKGRKIVIEKASQKKKRKKGKKR